MTDGQAGAEQSAPACYRHPDERTYVTCARCRRPICTQCMVNASVGFQCPECAGQGAPPKPTTPAGAPMIAKPTITYALIAINIAVFIWQYLVGMEEATTSWGMWPAHVAVDGQWHLLLTSAFLHGGFLHIAFNMYVLFALGPTLERVLGHWRYLLLYLLAALGGGVASYWFSGLMTVSVGASGAIFGLMGALVVAGKKLRYDITQVLILLGVNVALGFMSPGVDWRAHLGGLVTGALVAGIMVLPEKRHRVLVQVVGIGALIALMVILVVIRTNQITELLTPATGLSA